MKRKWNVLMAAMLALMVLLSSGSFALAQTDEEAQDNASSEYKPGLAIVAPRMYPVGEEVSMTVFDRLDQKQVKDAAIWALTRENAEALRAEVEELRASGAPMQEVDWDSLVSGYGFLLGATQGNGQLKYTFEQEGWYQLIAIKEGYFPDRIGIIIRTPQPPRVFTLPTSAI